MRSSRGVAVALVLAGGLLALVAGSRTWLSVTVSTTIRVTGREAAPAGSALALVALAGAVAMLTAGAVVRRVVAGLLVLAGGGLVAVRFAFESGKDQVFADAVARATGATSGAGDVVMTSGNWPWGTAAGGVLVLAGGAVALARAGRWAGPSRRFETAAAGPGSTVAGAAAERDRALDAWDALSAGEDPTRDDGRD